MKRKMLVVIGIIIGLLALFITYSARGFSFKILIDTVYKNAIGVIYQANLFLKN
jgi:hypothetical protein